jgi:hypothetical protein
MAVCRGRPEPWQKVSAIKSSWFDPEPQRAEPGFDRVNLPSQPLSWSRRGTVSNRGIPYGSVGRIARMAAQVGKRNL